MITIYILGGGCYGHQYARWLLLAKDRQKIAFDKLVIIDHDRNCKVSKNIKDTALVIHKSDWANFLSEYIKNAQEDTKDLFVPSHAAPHLLGKAFLSLIKAKNNKGLKINIELIDSPSLINTPIESKLETGLKILSYATWKCPANCIEPKTCPIKHQTRNWDLEVKLKHWKCISNLDALLIFSARHFAFAVSAIPAKTIIAEWMSLKKLLQIPGDYKIGVATTSACHGILSTFKISISS